LHCSQTEEFATRSVSLVFKSISSRAASQAAPERENLTSALAREIFGPSKVFELDIRVAPSQQATNRPKSNSFSEPFRKLPLL